MSFKCPKCPKLLSSSRRVQTHLAKKIPCDLKCRICAQLMPNSFLYTYHIENHEAPPNANENNEILVLEPVQQNNQQQIDEMRQKVDQIDFIPIEDFNWKYLQSIASKVEVTEHFYEKVSRSNGDDGNQEVERVQGYERRTKLTLRAENAKRCLPAVILYEILQCLDVGKRCELTEMMYQLLYDVHAQRAEPRLLTIRGNDINRKNVSIYSRPPPTDECHWVVNSNSVALKKTRDHCESLFNFALVSAIESLFPALTVDRGHIILWLVCPYKSGSGCQKAVTLAKDRDDNNVLEWHELHAKDLISIKTSENESYNQFLGLINVTIEERKNYVLQKLAGVELDDKRLNEFFELAKDASTGIM